LPPGRADRALQIAFMNPGAWSALSNDDHHLLCDLGEPHGPLFAWLDAHIHENGPEPWAALREAVSGHESAPYLIDQAERVLPDIEHDLDELRGILQRERERRLDEERRELSARAATDPAAYERLKLLWNEQKRPPSP
jgi:DNA primase